MGCGEAKLKIQLYFLLRLSYIQAVPVIRLSDDVFRRLQKYATPLVDNVNDVVGRILDEYEGASSSDGTEETATSTAVRHFRTGDTVMPKPFSHWTAWGGREHLDGSNLPGVYLVGKFDGRPPDHVDPLAPEVIFIGVTERQTLRKRWEQFAASAFARQTGHSGGWTFNGKYCNGQECPPPPWLHVAAMPLGGEESRMIRPLKQQLLADFAARRGSLPSCNTRSA